MKHTPYFGTPPGVASAPLFGNPAISALLTRGFASQPHGWFAVIGDSKSNWVEKGQRKLSQAPIDNRRTDEHAYGETYRDWLSSLGKECHTWRPIGNANVKLLGASSHENFFCIRRGALVVSTHSNG